MECGEWRVELPDGELIAFALFSRFVCFASQEEIKSPNICQNDHYSLYQAISSTLHSQHLYNSCMRGNQAAKFPSPNCTLYTVHSAAHYDKGKHYEQIYTKTDI